MLINDTMMIHTRLTMNLRSIPQVYTVRLVILLASILSYVFLQPTILSIWNPLYRRQLLTQFLSHTQNAQMIDPQRYWLFRERYSPGTMRVNTEAVSMMQTYRITQTHPSGTTELMKYESPRLLSSEHITTQTDALTQFRQKLPQSAQILDESSTYIVAELPEKKVVVAFQMPISEMKTANGFFDYLPAEEELLSGTKWFTVTYIQKD